MPLRPPSPTSASSYGAGKRLRGGKVGRAFRSRSPRTEEGSTASGSPLFDADNRHCPQREEGTVGPPARPGVVSRNPSPNQRIITSWPRQVSGRAAGQDATAAHRPGLAGSPLGAGGWFPCRASGGRCPPRRDPRRRRSHVRAAVPGERLGALGRAHRPAAAAIGLQADLAVAAIAAVGAGPVAAARADADPVAPGGPDAGALLVRLAAERVAAGARAGAAIGPPRRAPPTGAPAAPPRSRTAC